MSKEQEIDKPRKIGKNYAEFSVDEFKDPYTVKGLCEAIQADDYGLKINLSAQSTSVLNELLKCQDFFEKLLPKKMYKKWSLDVMVLISLVHKTRNNKKMFPEFNDPYDQINIRRLNRLLLEEGYPKETPKSPKYFIPPALISEVETFEDHYKVANGEPILIIGQTGVGKSLFLHIFEALYREEHEDEKKYPIVKANCAHFGGDPNLVRSELFGHLKGSFTGASYDKSGLVDMANGGVLVLEEIGDLPLETQAMLLTFIETGEFYRVGDDRKKSTKPKNNRYYKEGVDQEKEQHRGPRKARVQIIGLTNREDNLRNDFDHRFFPFYVRPIHQRREDILYYFYTLFPDLFDSMKPYEVFTLLTYHWPGNVREIERHGRLMRRKREGMKRMTFSSQSDRDSFDSVKLYNLDPNSPNVTVEAKILLNLLDDLMENDIDVKLLESILNKYQVGLKENRGIKKKRPIKDSFVIGDYRVLSRETSERYGLRFTYYIESFDKAYQGIRAFAELFYQDPMADVNLLDLKEEFDFGDPFDELIVYPEEDKDKFQKMIKSIFEFLSGIKLLESDTISINVFERDTLFTLLGKANPGNKFLVSLGFAEPVQEKVINNFDISSMKRDDLLKLYYQKVYDRGGTLEKAGKIAGMSTSNFREMYNKLAGKVAKKTRQHYKVRNTHI